MIYRTYQCIDCNYIFEIECESSSTEDPPCPECDKVLDWVPGMFSIKTERSRAVDYTQKVIEEDYGLTDLKDNNREGDVAFKPPPPMHTHERETVEQAVREYVRETTQPVPVPVIQGPQAQAAPIASNFWGAQPTGGISTSSVSAQLMLAGAKTGPAADVNPLAMLHQGIKAGHLSTKARIVSRWRP